MSSVDLSIIVVACSIQEVIDECFTALRQSQDQLNKEILYVDNGSTDHSVDLVREKFPEVTLIESPTNLGFIRANNLAYPKASGRYILLLNADAFVMQDSLQTHVDFMEQHPDCGALGCRLVDRTGVMQPSARYFPTPWNLFLTRLGWVNNRLSLLRGVDDLERDHQQTFECDWVPGCYLLTRKKIIDDLDFFLRDDFFMYFDDADLCLRIKKQGWKIYFYPSEVIHLGGANSAKLAEITEKGRQIEKYNIESEMIHFRKNYNLFYVLMDYFLIVLVACFRTLKKVFLLKKEPKFKEIWQRLALTTQIVWATRLGRKSIH